MKMGKKWIGLMFAGVWCVQLINPVWGEADFSKDDITASYIMEHTKPQYILEQREAFSLVSKYTQTVNETQEQGVSTQVYQKKDGIIYYSENVDLNGGMFQHIILSTDETDPYIYVCSDKGCDRTELKAEELDDVLTNPLIELDYDEVDIQNIEKEDAVFRIDITCLRDGICVKEEEILLDAEQDRITEAKARFLMEDGSEAYTIDMVFQYDGDIMADFSPKQQYEHEAQIREQVEKENRFLYETTDLEGNPISSEDVQEAKLIMYNFWEPWCGPCKSEMPDLEALYNKYKDQGLLIIGLFTTEEDAASVKEELGITYPLLYYSRTLRSFAPQAVPTTYFTDGTGKVLSSEPVVGVRKYDQWEELILEYLPQ